MIYVVANQSRDGIPARDVMMISYIILPVVFFQGFLGRTFPHLVPLLTFWTEVTEYELSERHLSDRLIRKSQAWRLFNKYIGE